MIRLALVLALFASPAFAESLEVQERLKQLEMTRQKLQDFKSMTDKFEFEARRTRRPRELPTWPDADRDKRFAALKKKRVPSGQGSQL